MTGTTMATEKLEVSTRERLLDAAEKLFADNGFEGTSVRDITAAAGCHNVAAINYYFGGKEKLYEASLLRLFRALREWRTEHIRREMAAFAGGCSLEDFLRVFVQSFLDELGDEERRQRLDAFIDREIRSARLHPARFNQELVQPVRDIISSFLLEFSPRLDRQTIELCIEFLMGHLVHARRLRDQLRSGRDHVLSGVDETQFVDTIVAYAAGGIRGAASGGKTQDPPGAG